MLAIQCFSRNILAKLIEEYMKTYNQKIMSLSAYSSQSETIIATNDTNRHLFSTSKWSCKKGCREIYVVPVMWIKRNTLDYRTGEACITNTVNSNKCLKFLVPFISFLRA